MLRKIKKHIKPTMDGKYIYCPHCKIPNIVFTFAWKTRICPDCKADVPKLEWLIR